MIATELARQDEVEEPLLTANRCLLAGRSRYRDARADNEKKNCLSKNQPNNIFSIRKS